MIKISYPAIALGSVLLVCLGALLNHYISNLLARGRDKNNRVLSTFNQAAENFRSEFVAEIKAIKAEESDPFNTEFSGGQREVNVYNILKDSLTKHTEAYETFRHYITGKDQTGLDKAWTDYLHPHGEKESQKIPLIFYAQHENDPSINEIALAKIESLLR